MRSSRTVSVLVGCGVTLILLSSLCQGQSSSTMVGPTGSCLNGVSSSWLANAENAQAWFFQMGYDTAAVLLLPFHPEVRNQLRSTENALTFMYGHSGDQYSLLLGCNPETNEDDVLISGDSINGWLSDKQKIRFSQVMGCNIACNQFSEPGYISYEVRKGSDKYAATIGFCQACQPCTEWKLPWQNAFYGYVSLGWTVKHAYDQALVDYPFPSCAYTPCMQFFGDTLLTLVPSVARTSWVSWNDTTPAPLNNNQEGKGVVVGDYNNDGRPDIYLINYPRGSNTNKLFKNNDSLNFENVAQNQPIADPGNAGGAAWGDYDNDGDLDLYVAVRNGSNKLFKCVGNDQFETVSQAQSYSYGACWGDYDNDGYLDIYVINNGANKLLRNNGDGTFSDVTSSTGVGDTGNGRGAAWGDYDNDGDLDLYVVNSAGPAGHGNRLFRNSGGVFDDVTAAAGVGCTAYGTKTGWGDYDNDGYLDLYVVNIYTEGNPVGNRLYHNDGDGTFTDVTSPNHLFGETSGFDAAWLDYDNDGDLDLYVVNTDSRCRLYRNDHPAGFFVDENETTENETYYYDEWEGMQYSTKYGQGVGAADFDADGALDLYVANYSLDYENVLYTNNAETDLGNNWLRVRLQGTESNRCGIGARVRIVVGSQSQIREISGGTGRSQEDLTASFGLGSAILVDTVEVLWPGPHHLVDVRHDIAANQTITLIEKPYIQNCDFAFAPDKPSCPFICPAGDASYNGHAPLRLEVTLKDYLGRPIVGYDDIHVTITPSEVGTFEFCCPETHPTVQSISTMGPSAPTDANGKAWIDVYWGGGYDQALEMRCYLNTGEQIDSLLTSLVRTPDLNADCSVNQQDLDIFISLYFTTDWRADFNCSGRVDLSDLVYITSHNGHSCGSQRTQPLSKETLTRLLNKAEEYASLDHDEEPNVPDRFSLGPNVPNPFNPVTQVRYTVPAPGARVSIEIFDVSGKRIKALVDGHKAAGAYIVTWAGTNDRGDPVPSGVYFCRLKGPGVTETRKMVLVR